eukprot:Lithocolla_globosa_v1_NODE_1541_length_2496_cov_46.810324.p3 type:complete len:186 gc:universal NODE_1541_length_2496_cov_46.810324:1888-1331(-)
MTAILSPNTSASSIECVVITITRPFFKRRMRFQISRRTYGSIPVVGSSRKTILGSPTKLRATERRRFMPPLKVPTALLPTSSNATSCSLSTTVFSTSSAGTFLSSHQISNISLAVRSFHRMSCCGHTPRKLRMTSMSAWMSSPNMSALPRLAFSMPVSMLMVVVFPAPLCPNKERICPSGTERYN